MRKLTVALLALALGAGAVGCGVDTDHDGDVVTTLGRACDAVEPRTSAVTYC